MGLQRTLSKLFRKAIDGKDRMTNRKKMTKEELAFKNRKLATKICRLEEIDDLDFDDRELMDELDELDENQLEQDIQESESA